MLSFISRFVVRGVVTGLVGAALTTATVVISTRFFVEEGWMAPDWGRLH